MSLETLAEASASGAICTGRRSLCAVALLILDVHLGLISICHTTLVVVPIASFGVLSLLASFALQSLLSSLLEYFGYHCSVAILRYYVLVLELLVQPCLSYNVQAITVASCGMALHWLAMGADLLGLLTGYHVMLLLCSG